MSKSQFTKASRPAGSSDADVGAESGAAASAPPREAQLRQLRLAGRCACRGTFARANTKDFPQLQCIGPLGASALVAHLGARLGDMSMFTYARQASAWLGLLPAQHSSGDKVKPRS